MKLYFFKATFYMLSIPALDGEPRDLPRNAKDAYLQKGVLKTFTKKVKEQKQIRI